jgi:hypothetical protein
MIRFSVDTEEIASLLRFLRRRAPNARLLMVPVDRDVGRRRAHPPLRRTARPLLHHLAQDAAPTHWAIYTSLDEQAGTIQPDGDTSLILLQFGPADALGRRDGLLEARDEITGEPPDFSARARVARSLVERCARRLRRRGHLKKGRWFVHSEGPAV